MTNFEVGDHVTFAGGQGEITKIEDRPNGGQLLQREREIEIKREHAERYFADQIDEWEERLETYQHRVEQGADMSAPIGNAKRELEKLRRQRNEELGQLEEEQHVTPEEPELVTAALVIPPGK